MLLAKRTLKFAGDVLPMKGRSMSKERGAGGRSNSRKKGAIAEPADTARAAQAAIRKNPDVPENYAVLAGALRTLAQSLRERNPQGSDDLLYLACAAAWEAKRRSAPELISGRTKQEIKILIAWLRMKNHVGPEASESLMDRIHSEHLSHALDDLLVQANPL